MHRRGDSAASDIVRRRLAPKGFTIIISKRDNPAIRRRRSRKDRATGILEALKAIKRKAPNYAVKDKEDSKTAEQTRDLAVKKKGSGKEKLPTDIIKRIKFGKKLIRKRSNDDKWDYRPAKEPDYNVGLKYFDEEENDEDEDEDEYWYEEDDEHPSCFPWYMIQGEYGCFDVSRKRLYSVRLADGGDLKVKELREWLQGALDRIKPGSQIRCFYGHCIGYITAYMSAEEADAIAGRDDVLYVLPNEQ